MPNYKPQSDYEKRMRGAGFIKVSAWIPADEREVLAEFARQLRERERIDAETRKRERVKHAISSIKRELSHD